MVMPDALHLAVLSFSRNVLLYFTGVIQFSSQSTSVQVDETVGVASLVVIRNPGSYGEVAVQYMVTAGKMCARIKSSCVHSIRIIRYHM